VPVGSLVIGFFVAVVCAYGLTEYLLTQLDGRRRLLDGGVRTLSGILTANLASFAIIWVGGLAFVVASGAEQFLYATYARQCGVKELLGEHLWAYYRDHPRLRPENGE